MVSRALIVACLFASTARAEIPADLLGKQGYKSPTSIFESATARVATAKKAGKQRVVLVTANDKIVDGGKAEAGVLTAADGKVAAPGFTVVELTYTKQRGDATEAQSYLWFVRENGTTACMLATNQTTTLNKGCGSSGWTSGKVKVTPDANATILDVQVDNSGHWSTDDGKGGCQQRSPVNSRHEPLDRWQDRDVQGGQGAKGCRGVLTSCFARRIGRVIRESR
jgi:hypothetical protein